MLSLITIIKVLKTYLPARWLTSGDSDFLKTQLSTSREPVWGNPHFSACSSICLSAPGLRKTWLQNSCLPTSLPTTWLPGLFSNCPSHPCQAEGLAETCQSHGHCGRREELWVMPHPHGQHLFRSLNQAGRPSLLPSTYSEDQAGNSHLSKSGKKGLWWQFLTLASSRRALKKYRCLGPYSKAFKSEFLRMVWDRGLILVFYKIIPGL